MGNKKNRNKQPNVNAADAGLGPYAGLEGMEDCSDEDFSDAASDVSEYSPSNRAIASATTQSSSPQQQPSTSSATKRTKKEKEAFKKQAAEQRRLDDVSYYVKQKTKISPASSVTDVLDAITQLASDSVRVIGRNKSVTKEDRAACVLNQDAIKLLVLQVCDGLLSASMKEIGLTAATTNASTQTDVPEVEVLSSSNSSASDVVACVREELAKFKEEFLSASGSKSYAAAASAAIVPKIKTPVSLPALVIASTDASKATHKDVLSAWRKDVDFSDTDFAPARVQTVSNNKVRVEFDNVQQRDAALEKLQHVPSLASEASRRRRPLVILKGIEKEATSADDFTGGINVIKRQNPEVASVAMRPDDIKFRFRRHNRKDTLVNVVLEVSPDVRLRMLEGGRVNIGHQRVRVQDFSPFVQCFRCLDFGHVQTKCTAKVCRCSHCAGTNHNVRDCVHQEDASKKKCFNCVAHNLKTGRQVDVHHSATSAKDCPRIRTMIERISGRIDYGLH